MSRKILAVVLVTAATALSFSAAANDRPPSASERTAIASALSAEGFSSWGKIEWDDDGYWEVDDAIGHDGKRRDLKLDKSYIIIRSELDD